MVTVIEWEVVTRNIGDFLFPNDLLFFIRFVVFISCITFCSKMIYLRSDPKTRVRRYPEKCNVNKNNSSFAKRILIFNNRLITLRKSVL
jgi:hypothetical protein